MNLAALPQEIIQEGLFCCWRYEERNGKKTKVPYQPLTGERARSNEPSCFSDYATAGSAEGYDGIGIGIFGRICAIDLDHCFTEDGRYTNDASEIVELMHSYTEVSPSGKGLHILFRADGFQYDQKKYYIMNHTKGIEVYVSGVTSKYVTVTGINCTEYGFGDRTEELKILLERYMKRPDTDTKRSAGNAINAGNLSPGCDEILRLAMNSRNGVRFQSIWNGSCSDYTSQSEADLALCRQLAFWTAKDPQKMDELFRKSGLMREKWDRPQAGTTYGQITIQKAIETCYSVYTPRRVSESNANQKPAKEAPALFRPMVPLTPQSCDLPSFPLSALPDTIRDYVEAVAEHSQTSPDMAAVIALGVLAVCLQGKYKVEGTPGYYEPLNLYVVVIAPPGERKSSVMRSMTKYLYDYEREVNEARKGEIRENRMKREALEQQIQCVKKKMETNRTWDSEAELFNLELQLEETPELKPIRYIADDCSSEALTSLIANNDGVFSVISTEGGIFDIMAGRYSNRTNIDVWLKGHCGDPIYVDRMTREAECIPSPSLSAILSIQPSVLDEIMSNTTMTGRGLIARFLYASPPSRIGSRVFCSAPISETISAEYRSLIFKLMALPKSEEAQIISLSQEAVLEMAEYFDAHEQYLTGEGQAISDWASKYIGSVLRIAGLIHAAEMKPEDLLISRDTIKRAISIGQYFLAHSAYAYSMMGTDLSIQKAKFVMAKIKKKGILEIKRSELFQICRGKFFKKTEEIFPTLELLEEHGYIRSEEPERFAAGRPADVRIYVNSAA